MYLFLLLEVSTLEFTVADASIITVLIVIENDVLVISWQVFIRAHDVTSDLAMQAGCKQVN